MRTIRAIAAPDPNRAGFARRAGDGWRCAAGFAPPARADRCADPAAPAYQKQALAEVDHDGTRLGFPALAFTSGHGTIASFLRTSYSVRTMIKTLTRTGDILALVIDKALLEATGITADSELRGIDRRGRHPDLARPIQEKDGADPDDSRRPRPETCRGVQAARRVDPSAFDVRRLMAVEFLTLDEVLAIHAHHIRRYGGRAGLRDRALLESALAMPKATFAGNELHSSITEKGAAYLFHLVKNHRSSTVTNAWAWPAAWSFFASTESTSLPRTMSS